MYVQQVFGFFLPPPHSLRSKPIACGSRRGHMVSRKLSHRNFELF